MPSPSFTTRPNRPDTTTAPSCDIPPGELLSALPLSTVKAADGGASRELAFALKRFWDHVRLAHKVISMPGEDALPVWRLSWMKPMAFSESEDAERIGSIMRKARLGLLHLGDPDGELDPADAALAQKAIAATILIAANPRILRSLDPELMKPVARAVEMDNGK